MQNVSVDAIQKVGGLIMVVGAGAVIGWLALQGNESAAGALIGVVSAGTGFYLRGKVEKQA